MDKEKNMTNAACSGMTDYMPASQSVSEKVTNIVGTFLNVESVRVKTTQIEAEKVTNVVGIFLKRGRNGFKKAVLAFEKVKTSKRKPEKVTNMVGTFFERGQKWF